MPTRNLASIYERIFFNVLSIKPLFGQQVKISVKMLIKFGLEVASSDPYNSVLTESLQ